MENLTPTEQADILIQRMFNSQDNDGYGVAKNHALICVEEIIASEKRSGISRECNASYTWRIPKEVDLKGNARPISYWQEVKKVLESKK